MRRGVYTQKVQAAIDLLPEANASLKVTRMPPYRLDCSQIGQTRVYGNGWSFIIPRDAGAGAVLSGYNAKCAAISFGFRQITAGEALAAALLAIYAPVVQLAEITKAA